MLAMTIESALTALNEQFRSTLARDLLLADEAAIRASETPAPVGEALLSHALRYGAVFRKLEPIRPFLGGARLAFDRALHGPWKMPDDVTPYELLRDQFTTNLGAFYAAELGDAHEEPAELEPFRVAMGAIANAFGEEIIEDARRNPREYHTVAFGGWLLELFALRVAARTWGVDLGALDDRILKLPLPKPLERLRAPLVSLMRDPAGAAALRSYGRAYESIINPVNFRGERVAGMPMRTAYALSLVKERGRMGAALLRMFDAA
jgi:hypothetical protein